MRQTSDPVDELEIVLSEEQIRDRIRELAETIVDDYSGLDVTLVAILKGSYLFLADISRLLPHNFTIDFIQVSSWDGRTESSGVVRIKKDLDESIEGKHVLLVEDIVDTGLTLQHLRELLATRKPASLKVVALTRKPDAMKHQVPVEYLGFDIENEFMVGYGLDYEERYRNLPYIAILKSQNAP